MAVAFDAFSNVAAGTGTLSWTHTPVGTPRGVKVDIVENGGTNGVSGVTYGGVAMELVAVNAKTSGEAGTVITYFLGSNIPAGAQTVSVTVSDAVSKRAGATTVTAATNTCWVSVDISIASDSIANPSSTLNLLGKTCFVSVAGHSGQNAATGTGQSSGWTNRLEHGFGAQTGVWYSYNTISTANVAVGWTQTADDAVMVAMAITEAPVAVDSHAIGFSESASVAVVFDSRSLPVKITESAFITILTSVGASDSTAIQFSESASITTRSISAIDSVLAGVSEAIASVGLAFSAADTAAVQIAIESSSKTESGSTAQQALPVHITDAASITAIAQNVSDSIKVQSSETSSVTSTTPSFTVSDSVGVSASESSVVPFPYSVESNKVTLTESRPVITAQGGELVLLVADSVAVAVSEAVNDLLVFIPGTTQNFVVSDSLRVALNGSGQTPFAKSASDSVSVTLTEPQDQTSALGVVDSVAVQENDVSSVNTGSAIAFFVASDTARVALSDTASIFANTVLTVTDSAKVLTVEDVPDEVTVVVCSDSLRVTVAEPSDQYSQFGVQDSASVRISAEVLQIGGLLSFTVADGIAAQLSESTSFGLIPVSANDSNKVNASELLTNSATVSSAESLRAGLIDIPAVFKDIQTTEALRVSLLDTAAPIFNSFIDITASDTCAVRNTESVTELVSFLTQISTSDSASVQLDASIAAQFAATVGSDQFSVISDDLASIFNPLSVSDSMKIGTLEAGLAIPIVTVGVSAFTDDPLTVTVQDNTLVTAQQPTAEEVAAVLIESVFVDRSIFVADSSACRISERTSVFTSATAEDSLSLALSDNSIMTAAYQSNDGVAVVCSEHTDGYAVVANATPNTWNGHAGTEHRNDKPKPWKYIFTDKHNW